MRTRRRTSLFQRLSHLTWSNKATVDLAGRAINLAYLARGWRRGPAGAEGVDPTASVAPDLVPLARYRADYEHLEGWFQDGAAATWSCLLALQAERGIVGDLMEIGVFKGKSATLIALHAAMQETLVLVDPVLRKEATDAIQQIRSQNNILVRDVSENLAGHSEVLSRAGRFRWIHIDGEHSARAVTNDLRISVQLLGSEGVICLDDFVSSVYPQVTLAVFRFLDQQEGGFTLFLCGFNKGYICKTAAARPYLEYLLDRVFEELGRRNVRDVKVCKTAHPDEMNCFGIVPARGETGYKGPDKARISI